MPVTTLERIKAKIIETGKNFKKRSTIAGKPLYLTKMKGIIRGIQVTRPEKITANKRYLLTI